VTVATIHQRLADEHRLDASVASVRRWIRGNLPEEARRAQVTVLRDCPPPGSEAQIDYGRLGMWLDPATGRRRTRGRSGSGRSARPPFRPHRDAVDTAAGPVDELGLGELIEHETVQPIPTPAACQARSRRLAVWPDP
jgi:hypothetical protein